MITIDRTELDALVKELGLILPVYIGEDNDMPRLGEYRGGDVPEEARQSSEEDEVTHHMVFLNADGIVDNDDADENFILMHELAHCKQAERAACSTDYEPGAFFRLYEEQMVSAGFERSEEGPDGVARLNLEGEDAALYSATPFELEANFIAARYAGLYRPVSAIDREGS